MTLHVLNRSEVDICLSVNNKEYRLSAVDSDTVLETNQESPIVVVRRATPLSPPDHKKLLLAEMLGIFSVLFIKPIFYYFDVSSTYRIPDGAANIRINVSRVERGNAVGYYDVIYAEASEVNLYNAFYRVENEATLLQAYKKCRRTAHFWLYLLIEVLFTTIGVAISNPLLSSIYAQTQTEIIKALMILTPISIILFLALFCILPMHLIFRHSDRNFYRAMEHSEIANRLG